MLGWSTVNSRQSDARQSTLGWSMVDSRMVNSRCLDGQWLTLRCSTVDGRMVNGRLRWSMVDAWMVNGRWLDARQSMADGWMLNGRCSDAQWLTLGCSTMDGWTMTNDDRPTMTDARRVHHEANTDDLALRCAPMVALVNFLFYFP